jgi:Zn-dependent oligopeptidase
VLRRLPFIFVKIYYACAGYLNFAEMSMVTKMAGSVEAVNTMLLSMLAGARTAQEIELATLQARILFKILSWPFLF